MVLVLAHVYMAQKRSQKAAGLTRYKFIYPPYAFARFPHPRLLTPRLKRVPSHREQPRSADCIQPEALKVNSGLESVGLWEPGE